MKVVSFNANKAVITKAESYCGPNKPYPNRSHFIRRALVLYLEQLQKRNIKE